MDTSITHIRPRFELNVKCSQLELLQRFKNEISLHDDIKARLVNNHVILDVIEKERHFWSPHIDARVEIDENNENHSIIYGLIGPRPTVWTLFTFIYFSIGIIGFIITSHGISSYMMGEFSYTIWAFPIAILIMLTAYNAGKMGEKLGAEQTEKLKTILRNVIK